MFTVFGIITKKMKILQVKQYPYFGLKVIQITTTKSDLDKNHYLVFPPFTKITIILGPLVVHEIKTKGPKGPLGPLLRTHMFINIL